MKLTEKKMKKITLLLSITFLNFISFTINAQWQKTILPLVDNEDLYGISFLNDQSYFICSNTQIAKTSNSGQSWQLVYTDSTLPRTFPFLTNIFLDLHFFSSTQGLATGVFNLTNDELVVGTLTGGNSWSVNYANSPFNFPVFFNDIEVNGSNVLACGTHGHIIRSTNYGSSFSTVNNTPDVELTEIKFVTATKAIAIGEGKVFSSLNAGLTWSIDATFAGNRITSISVSEDGLVYIMGDSVLFKSVNNGVTYTQLPIPPSDMIEGSNLVASHDTLFIGSFVSVSGGKSWLQFKSIKNQHINKLTIRNGKVYALCKNKTLLVMEIAKAGGIDASPIASFSAVAGDNCAGKVRQFNNTTSQSPDYAYKWWLNDSLISTGYNLSVAFPNPGQTYEVMLTVSNGFATDTVKKQFQTIALGKFPKGKLMAQPVCAFYNVELRYDSVFAGFPYQLWRNDSLVIPEWKDIWGRSQPLISSQPTTNAPVTFVITANFTDGCINTLFADTLRVVPVQDVSILQITFDKPQLCPGDSTLIRISPTQVGNVYTIDGISPPQQGNGGELVFRTGALPEQTNKFRLSVNNPIAGCRSSREIPMYVHTPEAIVYPQNKGLTNQPIIIKNFSQYTAQWEWQFGLDANPTHSNLPEPIVTFSKPGYYAIQLIVTAGGGCKDTIKSQVDVFNPATFSENEVKFTSEIEIRMPDFAAYFYHRITDTKADNQGNTYIVGRRSDTLTAYNRISEVGFIQKRNAAGQLLWEQYFIPNYPMLYGKEDMARCHVIEIDPKTGNIWVAGEFKSQTLKIGNIMFDNLQWENHFVAKFNSEGKVLWVNLLFNENFGFKNEVRGPSDLVYAGCNQLYLIQYGHGGVIKRSGGLPDQSWGGDRSWKSGSAWFLRFDESGKMVEDNPLGTGGYNIAHWGGDQQLPAYRCGPRMKLTPQGNLLFYAVAVRKAIIGDFSIDAGDGSIDIATPFLAVWNPQLHRWMTAFPVCSIPTSDANIQFWDKSIFSPGFAADANGNIIVSFSQPAYPAYNRTQVSLPDSPPDRNTIPGEDHSFMFKFNPMGKRLWLNINRIQQIVGLDVLSDGSIIQVSNIKDLAGFQPQGSPPIAFPARGSMDWIISKWSPDGGLKYAQNFGTNTYDQAYLLRSLGCSRYALLHSVNSDSTGNLGLVAQPRLAIFTLLNEGCSDTLSPCMVSADNQLNTIPISVNLFPNPNTGNFTVEWEGVDFKNGNIQIVNTLRQVQYTLPIPKGINQLDVQIRDLPLGVYFLQVVSEGSIVAVEKFVKQ